MIKFIRLLSFEFNRFLKFLLPTFLVVLIVQLFEIFSAITNYNTRYEQLLASGQQAHQIPPFSAQSITSGSLYDLSILFIVGVFMFYSFFTWYREWSGRNTFIYRLLMLPMNRMHIFTTKALVFLIGGFLAFVFQFGMYGLALFISEQLIPADQYVQMSVHQVQPMYNLIQHFLFPTTFFEFISRYSFAFGALVSLFTGIVMERTFRMKGLFAGMAYFIGYFVIYLLLSALAYGGNLPIIIKPSTTAIIILIYQFVMIALGFLISWPLLKNRIKV